MQQSQEAGGGSRPWLEPVGQLEQGLLAVDDVQMSNVGLQLLMLLWRHVTSKLVSPAVSQGSHSVCNHVLQGNKGNTSVEGRVTQGVAEVVVAVGTDSLTSTLVVNRRAILREKNICMIMLSSN